MGVKVGIPRIGWMPYIVLKMKIEIEKKIVFSFFLLYNIVARLSDWRRPGIHRRIYMQSAYNDVPKQI